MSRKVVSVPTLQPLTDTDRATVEPNSDAPRGWLESPGAARAGSPGARHRTSASGRDAVPDHLLPDLPRAVAASPTLESSGVMAEMNQRLSDDEALAAQYRAAHEAYLADRDEIGSAAGLDVPEIAGVSAGGCRTGSVPARPRRARAAAGPGSTRSGTRRWT